MEITQQIREKMKHGCLKANVTDLLISSRWVMMMMMMMVVVVVVVVVVAEDSALMQSLWNTTIWSYEVLFTTKAEYNHTKQTKEKKEIVHNYMYVNCWTNQTILSALALLRKFMRIIYTLEWRFATTLLQFRYKFPSVIFEAPWWQFRL